MNPIKILRNGLLEENPIFVQAIGMCPTLAVTTSAINGLGMGIASTMVLTFSNLVISLLRNFIPATVRIPAFVVVISTFVTIVQFLLQAYLPSLNAALGIFIPLIVVNCIILARAEAFASKNNVVASALDGIGMGLGFTSALFIIGCVRELIGAGSLFDIAILPEFFPRTIIMILPPGAFITLGALMAGLNALKAKQPSKSREGGSCKHC
ncbi:MAG: electron transport complex subunit E [Clostridiales bacterium]|jgi:electron transport complex protein RnfE|nr:electron transport complex subunit E [Clostridiales bacterium]